MGSAHNRNLKLPLRFDSSWMQLIKGSNLFWEVLLDWRRCARGQLEDVSDFKAAKTCSYLAGLRL